MNNEEITMEILKMLCDENKTKEEVLKTGIVDDIEIEENIMTVYYKNGKVLSHWL